MRPLDFIRDVATVALNVELVREHLEDENAAHPDDDASTDEQIEHAAEQEARPIRVYCGFIPGSSHFQTLVTGYVDKNEPETGASKDPIVLFMKGTEQSPIEDSERWKDCVILHVEGTDRGGVDTQLTPSSVFIEIEARFHCDYAYSNMDLVLAELERTGALIQVLSRYDEPISDLQLETSDNYGSHSAVVEVAGICPDYLVHLTADEETRLAELKKEADAELRQANLGPVPSFQFAKTRELERVHKTILEDLERKVKAGVIVPAGIPRNVLRWNGIPITWDGSFLTWGDGNG